jgi:hypothetical protein
MSPMTTTEAKAKRPPVPTYDLDHATITLNAIRAHSPCEDGWRKLLAHLGKTKADDAPLPLLTVLDSNGLDDALWCLRALPPEYDAACRLLACDFAEPALRFVPENEDRPRIAIETVRRFALGLATPEELNAARAAAWASASARAAARAAASAAARDAASAAASAAARDAAWASAAARDAASAAARDAQVALFRERLVGLATEAAV